MIASGVGFDFYFAAVRSNYYIMYIRRRAVFGAVKNGLKMCPEEVKSMRGKALAGVGVFAVIAVFAFAVPSAAQENAWEGGDAEDIGVPSPARLLAEADGSDPDFTAALEAAAAAESRNAAADKDKGKGKEKMEFVPKNEIVITKNPVDTTARKADKKKAPSGPKMGHTMGGRLGIGTEIELGLGLGIGLTDAKRLDLGVNMGYGFVPIGSKADGFGFFEAYVLYEWLFNISEELNWFTGLGGSIGYHNATWKAMVPIKPDDPNSAKREATLNSEIPFGIGVGGRIGLEVDLSFIDPDHTLSSLRSSLVGIDFRPMLCIFDGENYPWFVMTVGINYNYIFGGGKGKDKK